MKFFPDSLLERRGGVTRSDAAEYWGMPSEVASLRSGSGLSGNRTEILLQVSNLLITKSVIF